MNKRNNKEVLMLSYPNIPKHELKKTLEIYYGISGRCKNHPNYRNVSNKFKIVEFYEFLLSYDYFERRKSEVISVCRFGDVGDYCKENCSIKSQSENFKETLVRTYKIYFSDGTEKIIQCLHDLYKRIKNDLKVSKSTFYLYCKTGKPLNISGIYKIIKL
ncbi:TPA: hypothetical protein NKQ35_000618 [Vibrio parahaemolyticus]|nr:hypothetical protein [Vibrio parahaemolyticus]HCH1528227.1 hypothetical protein [Vibrio parahaemolyticus]